MLLLEALPSLLPASVFQLLASICEYIAPDVTNNLISILSGDIPRKSPFFPSNMPDRFFRRITTTKTEVAESQLTNIDVTTLCDYG